MSSRVIRAAGRSRKMASLLSFHSIFQTERNPCQVVTNLLRPVERVVAF